MALQEVLVTSHHAHTHKDKHLGIAYVFEPNKKVQVPLAAAVHFFGVGLPKGVPARQASWKRYGFTDEEKGEAYLRKFEVKVVDLVPAGSDVEDLKEEHEKNIEELKGEHDKSLSDLEEDHREEVKRLMDKVAALEAGETQKKK